jgi:hypothetical protein
MWSFSRSLMSAGIAVSLCAFFAFEAGASVLNQPAGGAYFLDDNEVPEITAKVARISVLSGEARVRRGSEGEWESAVMNLPLVEGDEIATDADTRLEIQFDRDRSVRLGGNAYLRIMSLKDDGITLSLPLGSMSVRLRSLGSAGSYFEIDAPKTTIALQAEGTYRVDSGDDTSQFVRVSVTEGGEARVYSETAGFALKNGRSARIFTSGNSVGEWELGDASRYTDALDNWATERERTVATNLRNANYDQYYDQDIYGAEELNDNGRWLYLNDYGYVWQPSRAAVSRYSNWSPYRYGHWRWMPPYGWVWVNDEAWGWATYHHGRWFHHGGGWYWSPYGHFRYARSWWYPALVAFNMIGNNICWYPLPYSHGFYNYNIYYINYYGWRNGRWGGPRPGGDGPAPTNPTGGGPTVRTKRSTGALTDLTGIVPVSGVIAVRSDEFGAKTRGTRTAPPDVAADVLRKPSASSGSPVLPDRTAVGKRMDREIRADAPRVEPRIQRDEIGAAPRKADVPLDRELQRTRIQGGRTIVPVSPATDSVPANDGPGDGRKTGVIQRQPPVIEPVRPQPPASTPAPTRRPLNTEPIRPEPPASTPAPVRKPRAESEPVRPQPPTSPPPLTKRPPSSEPVRPQPPTSTPAPTRRPPSSEPVRPQPPSYSPPPSRSEPVRPAPAPAPPPRKEAPKSEPKPEAKPRRDKSDTDQL